MIVLAVALVIALVVQQILHARERATLLDRIQAPEQVAIDRAPEPSGEVTWINPEDDEAWAKFQRENGTV